MVKLFMDFDSTITEESTLMQLYLRLPKELLAEATKISNDDYYKYEEPLTKRCYSNIRNIINWEKDWDKCLNEIKCEVLDYSRKIEGIEIKGMTLIENVLKSIDLKDVNRAASQTRIRPGFNKFVKKFDKNLLYVLSFNWSDYLINLVCPSIVHKNIISNRLKFKTDKCLGFDKNRILLTPKDKINYFNNLKNDKNIFCGDSLPDLLPCLYSDIAFVFVSHDKEFALICNLLSKKFVRPLYVVNNFNEASQILNRINLKGF